MRIAQTAARLLKKFGEAVTFTYSFEPTVDPVTGELVSGADVTYSGFGYPSQYEAQELIDSVIEYGDIRLIVEKVDEVPKPNWKCTIDDTEYTVMDVQRIKLSGNDIIYICQLRR